MSDEDAPAVVDQDVLDELEHSVGDDRAFLRELVETYLDETPTLVTALRSGVAEGNVERTNRAAHTIKSTSASLGALGLSAMARELETLTSTATTESADLAAPEIAALIALIATEYDEVAIELSTLVPATDG
jgi:HPt (histidine-containing phosphotransfer) domain-containing protein